MFSDVFKKTSEPDAPMPVEAPRSSPQTPEKRMTKGAILSEDVEFKGTLSFSSTLEVNGRFEGEILADGPLIIGDNAVVKATIHAASSVIVKGKLQGNITAKERVEISSKAQVYGDIVTPKFSLAEGAVFVGNSRTTEKTTPPTEFTNLFTRLDKPKGAASAPASVSSSS